jgi:mitochondrial fission protein ELM1
MACRCTSQNWKGGPTKFDKLHESLIAHGAARWFDGTLETWTYAPLREADRVADAIVDQTSGALPAAGYGAIKLGCRT